MVEQKIFAGSATPRERRCRHLLPKFSALILCFFAVAMVAVPSMAAKVIDVVTPTNSTPGISLELSTGQMDIDVIPGATGYGEMTATVSTTGAAGYTLQVSSDQSDGNGGYTNALIKSGSTQEIQALASTVDTGTSSFPQGYWGYATDAQHYKDVPNHDSQDQIASSSVAINNDVTDVKIGVAPGVIESGVYSNVMVFTAIANPITLEYELDYAENVKASEPHGDNGEGTSVNNMPANQTAQTADVYKKFTIPNTTPEREGYTFLGWAETDTATAAQYVAGDEVTIQVADINTSIVTKKTLYAVWKLNSYTVKFDGNGGAIPEQTQGLPPAGGTEPPLLPAATEMADMNFDYFEKKNLTTNLFEKTGYNFLGWNTNSSATTALYTDGEEVSNLTITDGGVVTLYAIWEAETFTVKFHANGGTGTMTDQEYTYGVAQALSDNAFIRADHLFRGWAKLASSTTALYQDKESITVSEDLDLYAVWEEMEYIQDFNAETDLLTLGDSKVLYDKRDKVAYSIKRLADGNVWMTQNLRYVGLTEDPGTETPADGTFNITNDNSAGSLSGVSRKTTGWSTSDITNKEVAYNGNETMGGYYSWTAANAVCPAGWHLPSRDEFVSLDVAVNGTGAGLDRTNAAQRDALMSTTGGAPGFVYAGYYDGSLSSTDGVTFLWASTASTGNYAQYMLLNSVGYVYPQSPNLRYYGGSVRCVANDSTKVKYIQDFNDAIDLRTVGDTDTYTDRRDNKTYTVARLADGKVWMTQNIAYETGATQMRSDYGGYYLRANADSICPTGWHLPSTAEFSALDRAYGGAGTGKNANAPSYSKLAGEPAKWTMSGFYRTTNTQYGNIGWDQVGVNGYYMASDVNTVHVGNIMTANILPETRTTWMDANTTANTYATNIRCVGDQPNTFYIQDFNESTMLPNTGDMATLTDKRDGETYNVTRLADGNVWMAQNLRLTMTAGETLTSENTDAPANGLYVDYTTRTSGGVAWDRTTARSYNSGVRDYGVYYNWYSATAGTRSADYSICPSGWRLPSAAEYGTLMSTYSFNQTTIRNAPFYMSTSDHYNDAGTVYNRGALGHLWTSTTNGTDNAYFMFFNVSSINNMATHSQAYGFAVRCVARDNVKVMFDANGGTGTMAMQSFTRGTAQSITANTFTRSGYEFAGWALTPDATTAKYVDQQLTMFSKPTTLYAVWKTNYIQDFDAKTTLMNTGESMTLVDKRDESTYTVKRLPDGKVWMTQNLRYTGSTDLGTSSTGSGSFTIDAANSEGSGAVSFVSSFSSTTSAKYAKYNGNVTYGAYYNWFAALNVCPSGWHLPSSAEQVAMDVAYGGTGQQRSDATMYSNYQSTNGNWPGMVLAGYYHDSVYETSLGLYWSSTAYGSTYAANDSAKFFYLTSNTTIMPDYSYAKWFGRSVRCVANETETVTFNANGGTGTMAAQTVSKGENVTLATNTLTRPAYNFLGWATSASATIAEYADGATITPTADMTLYAVWVPVGEFMQNFNQNMELLTAGSTKTLYDERDGEAYTVRRLQDGKVWMTKNLAYTEGGKYKYQSSYGAYYNWNDALTVCPSGWHIIDKDEVKALDLAWGGTGVGRSSANTYSYFTSADYLNVTFGGRYFGDPMTLQRTGNEAIYWTGNEFVGDSTAGNDFLIRTDRSLAFYDTAKSYKVYNEQPVRCVADYNEVTISFNANGGSGTTMTPITRVAGQSATIPANTYTRSSDYKFLGWSTSDSATTPEYVAGDTITVTQNTTLYAVWDYLVAFTANGRTWTKVLGKASFANASSLCPSGYRVPTKDELRTLIGASSDNVWMSNSTVTMLNTKWNNPYMVWSSNAYGSGGAWDLFFKDGQAIITATSNASSSASVVCLK